MGHLGADHSVMSSYALIFWVQSWFSLGLAVALTYMVFLDNLHMCAIIVPYELILKVVVSTFSDFFMMRWCE